MAETTKKTRKRADASIGGRLTSNLPFETDKDVAFTKKEVIKEFMTEPQANDQTALVAEETFNEVCAWLERRGVRKYVNTTLLELYAMTFARWVQAERKISEFGFLSAHPTTGQPCISPYITISLDFCKQANNVWYQIANEIKEGTNGQTKPEEPTNSLMALLKDA